MSDQNSKQDSPSQILSDDLYQLRMELEAKLVMDSSDNESINTQPASSIKKELRTLSHHLSYALGKMTLNNDQSHA